MYIYVKTVICVYLQRKSTSSSEETNCAILPAIDEERTGGTPKEKSA
jgi:hypothetical protein